jgi:YidC/Oxa1 family membrane protein insertase
MDRKSIIILVITFILLMAWYPLIVKRLYPPQPLPPSTNTVAGISTSTNPPPSMTAAPSTVVAPAPLPSIVANTNVAEELLEATNDNAHYTFSSYGGGLKTVELLHYPETVATRVDKPPKTNNVAILNAFTPAPTMAVLGGAALQGDGIFKLTRTATGVRAEKQLTNGLAIVKEFELSSNYIVSVSVRLANTSTQTLDLPEQEWVVGTATPMSTRDNGMAVGVLWSDGAKTTEAGASYFAKSGFACMPRTPPAEYRAGASNVVWAAAHNQYFTLAAMPQQPALQVVVYPLNLPRPAADEARLAAENVPLQQGYEGALVYPAVTLGPKQTLERQIFLYAGPKEYQTLARLAAHFGNNIDLAMQFGFFSFFAKALLLAMNTLHRMTGFSYGWAIVAITVIIKIVYWPLTQSSMRSMKRMQTLQPQMNAIKEKYKDDPVKMNKRMMEFMRENKINPVGGCLPSLLQIPVFYGFFTMIRSAIELRGASWLWVSDLSKPDTLFVIPGLGFVPIFGVPGLGLPFNLLPLIMGVTMLFQARMTPPSAGMDPAQARMMRYMPLMFLLFLYNYSAGLTLYWTVQNVLTIVQTKLTRTAAGPLPAGKVPVLTPPAKKRK